MIKRLPSVVQCPEVAMLCWCVSRGARAGVSAPPDVDSTFDWDRLLAEAHAHGVTELLLAPLERRSRTARAVPAPILEFLQSRQFGTTGLNLNRVTQVVSVLGLLSANGIRALTYKGPTLAAGVHGNLGQRLSNDLDILVDRKRVARVRELLLADGYVLPPRVQRRVGSLLHGLLPGVGREDTLLPGQPWQTSVDVHVAFAFWMMGMRLDTNALFDRSVTVEVAGHPVQTLSPGDLLLVLAIHGMMHGWAVLRFVSDIEAVAAQVTDWDAVFAHARSARMLRPLRVALLLAGDLLCAQVPSTILDLSARDSGAVDIARGVASRLFSATPHSTEPGHRGPWFLAFQERPTDRLRFHVRTLAYEWLLKWPWDAWLGRRA